MLTNEEKPWHDLKSYQEGHKIYGREEEILQISTSVQNDIHTILYGKSGVGKTSLLQAGCFPKLRKLGFFPVILRLAMFDTEDYVETVIQEIQNSIKNTPKIIIETLNVEKYTGNKLIDFFGTNVFYSENGIQIIPMLVFDQFEELINNRKSFERAKDFLLSLYPLIDDSVLIPTDYIQYSNYRIVFSLREDYLYCFEDLIDQYNLSELKYNRFRIKPLTEAKAAEVIRETFSNHLDDKIQDEVCMNIILKSQDSTNMKDISSPILSLLGSVVWDNMHDGKVTLEAVQSADILLFQYYNEHMSNVSPRARKYLEQHLITNDGRRDSLDYNVALNSGKITEEEILLLANKEKLINLVNEGRRIEFVHDIITTVIGSRKKKFIPSVISAYSKIMNFTGTMSVREYKYLVIANILPIYIVSYLMGRIIVKYNNPFAHLLFIILLLFILLDSMVLLSSTVRRLHDVGKSGFQIFNPLTWIYTCQKPQSKAIYKGRYSKYDPLPGLSVSLDRGVIVEKYSKEKYIAYCIYAMYYSCLCSLFFSVIFTYLITDAEDSLQTSIEFLMGIFISYFVCMLAVIMPLHVMGRLAFLNKRKWLALIPVVNIYYFVMGFKNDINIKQNSEPTISPKYKYEIFLGYRREGGTQFAGILALMLQQRGYKVFYDVDAFTDGFLGEYVNNAIKDSLIYMLVLSPNSLRRSANESDWLRKEIETALRMNKEIILINPDNSFDGWPADLPTELCQLKKLQMSDIDFGSLLGTTLDNMIKNILIPMIDNKTSIK